MIRGGGGDVCVWGGWGGGGSEGHRKRKKARKRRKYERNFTAERGTGEDGHIHLADRTLSVATIEKDRKALRHIFCS